MIRTKLYIDMDDTLCQYSKKWKRTNDMGIKFPQSQIHFFQYLEPHYQAVEAVKLLSDEYDVWILTAPSVYNPLSYTEKRIWVEDHLGFDMCKKLIICPNKGLIVGHQKFILGDTHIHEYSTVHHILIDDLTHGKGQENFTGKLLQFGSDQYPDWKSITNYLLKRI